MKLFQDIIDNTYQIVQYKTKDHINNKFKLKYPNHKLIDKTELNIQNLECS